MSLIPFPTDIQYVHAPGKTKKVLIAEFMLPVEANNLSPYAQKSHESVASAADAILYRISRSESMQWAIANSARGLYVHIDDDYELAPYHIVPTQRYKLFVHLSDEDELMYKLKF